MLDTLKAKNDLTEAGFPEDRAEAIAVMIREVHIGTSEAGSFDPSKAAKILTDAGFPENQAEAMAKVVCGIISGKL